ncbi:MAG: magnesium/cobalt transporter CorA [Gemmatimonadales bacterium]|nr:magnesium/cobalt transporter CorA [Gemmatimonadales bacterium]
MPSSDRSWLSGESRGVNIDGLGDAQVVRELGDLFGLHPLALEDVLHVTQRPKAEEYDGNLYLVLRMTSSDDGFATEQVSLFLGHNFVVTFQEHPGDSFEPVRQRLLQQRGQIRLRGADYLAYALVDATIDGYFPVLETYGDRLEAIEQDIAENPTVEALADVQRAKRDLRRLRRAIWPLREYLNAILREPTPLISEHTTVYLRDCSDHAVRILDLVESYREWSSDLSDLYVSTVNTRMNDVMRVLTIFAAIFIPLTFVAGIYGMNFQRMPELAWYFGYPLVLTIMASVGVTMVFYFRRKGWIGAGPTSRLPRTCERTSTSFPGQTSP